MRSFVKGKPIKSLNELMQQEFVIQSFDRKDVLVHRGWFQSWQLRYVSGEIERRRLFRAKRKEASRAGT